MATLRDHSRQAFTGDATIEAINAGSLQRIADATEKVAANYDAMVADRDRFRRWYESEQATNARLHRRLSAVRGVITRMKRKAAAHG